MNFAIVNFKPFFSLGEHWYKQIVAFCLKNYEMFMKNTDQLVLRYS